MPSLTALLCPKRLMRNSAQSQMRQVVLNGRVRGRAQGAVVLLRRGGGHGP